MTDEQVIQYLQSIVIQAIELKDYVSGMVEEEREALRQMDEEISSLLDYFEENAE